MKDALLMIGALSTIGKKMVMKELQKQKELSFILVDTPKRSLELSQYATEILTTYPHADLVTVLLDVTKVDSIESILEAAIVPEYRIKDFVYLVGTNKLKAAFAVTEEIWDNVLNLNLKGFFFTAQFIGTLMMQSGGGSIVSIASQHGVAPNYERAAYCSSKAGLIHLSEVLALEWAKYEIRVNTVSPTFIITEGNAHEVATEAFSNKWLNSIPLHRFAMPEDVADAVLFLLSDQAKMITGHNLVVDGGWLLKHS